MDAPRSVPATTILRDILASHPLPSEIDRMGHAHHTTLDRIFAHPMDMNIHWREIVHMFEALGGTADETHHGRLKVKLGEHERSFRIPHHSHSLDSRDELVEIRHFLEAAGHKPVA